MAFCGRLDVQDCRPYRTEVQLYKSLLALKRGIDFDCIITSQRETLSFFIKKRTTDQPQIIPTEFMGMLIEKLIHLYAPLSYLNYFLSFLY